MYYYVYNYIVIYIINLGGSFFMVINHGANLFDLSNKLNVNEDEFLDFSSNINPFGACPNAKEAVISNIDKVSIYPDVNYLSLKTSISNYCRCKTEHILLGSGSTELISTFIEIIKPKNALIISPTYSEYERELKKSSCNISYYFAKKEDDFKIDVEDLIHTINDDLYDLVVICNPNNPTGFAFTQEEIKEILKYCSTYIMLDETYVEFIDTNVFSSTPLIDRFSNLFIIRSTSKFFSAPGIRLGYALTSDKEVLKKMNDNLDLWNINIFASLMGEVMFNDLEYIYSSLEKIQDEHSYLMKELNSIDDLKVYPSSSNFILCEITSKKLTSSSLYETLIKSNVIIRDCSSFNSLNNYFFRVCVLKHNDNKLLINLLKDIFS